jgi:hypothetical protein
VAAAGKERRGEGAPRRWKRVAHVHREVCGLWGACHPWMTRACRWAGPVLEGLEDGGDTGIVVWVYENAQMVVPVYDLEDNAVFNERISCLALSIQMCGGSFGLGGAKASGEETARAQEAAKGTAP